MSTLHLLTRDGEPIGTNQVTDPTEIGQAVIDEKFDRRVRVHVNEALNVSCMGCDEHPCSHEHRVRRTLQDINKARYVHLALLSPRERDIHQLKNDGLSNEEIAAELDITEGTVRGQLQRIREKRREAQALTEQF